MRNHIAAIAIALCAATSVAPTVVAQQAPSAGIAVTRPASAGSAAPSAQKPAPIPEPSAQGALSTGTVSGVSEEPADTAGQTGQDALVASNASQPGTIGMSPARDVITDDDLQAMRSGVAINYLWSQTKVPPSVNPAVCDRDCESEARAAAGMSRSPNSEWQAQFAAARIDLAADKEWRAAYLDGLLKAHQYCVFRHQGNSALMNQSGSALSGEREQYVGDMNQALGQGVDSAAARVQEEIEQVERTDSVRAAMMEILAERAFNQCSGSARK